MIKRRDYPKSLHVGSEQYTVKFVRKFDEPIVGDCNSDTKTIRILSTLGRVEMFRTFLHEVLHALEFEYGLKIKHKLVYQMEEALFRLIVENFWDQ